MPIVFTFRLLFKEFLDQVPIDTVAFMHDCDPRTVSQHYRYARLCIHGHMEALWEQNPTGRHAVHEREPEHLVARGLPAGVEPEYNTPAVEVDESLLTHIHYPGAVNQVQRQCWALGVWDRHTRTAIVRVVGP